MSGFYNPTPPSEAFLMHFNPFHDRKNGQFTSKSGGSVSKNKRLSATGGSVVAKAKLATMKSQKEADRAIDEAFDKKILPKAREIDKKLSGMDFDGDTKQIGKVNNPKRDKAKKDYEQHKKYKMSYMDPNGRVKVKTSSGITEMDRYQTIHKDIDKKKGTAYEYTIDMLNKTPVSKEKIKYTKDRKGGKSLGFEKLSDNDYNTFEKEYENREVYLAKKR